MSEIILHEEKGKDMILFIKKATIEEIKEETSRFSLVNEDGELRSVEYKDPITQADVDQDVADFLSILDPAYDWDEKFGKLPTKKNGSFAKSRVLGLARASSQEVLWEDSYGYNGPEIIVRTIDDRKAEVVFEYRTEKY
jgi:hypothetical protein